MNNSTKAATYAAAYAAHVANAADALLEILDE